MAMNPWTTGDIIAKVDSEGLGYMVESYLSADEIADPHLAELWRMAYDALAALDSYLAEHDPATDETSATPEPDSLVTFGHERILCDTPPTIFDSASVDEYDCYQLTSGHGGKLRLNLNGGRFESDPEVYITGTFARAELETWLHNIAPHAAKHLRQTIAFGDGHYALFANGTFTSPSRTRLTELRHD